MLKRVLLLGVSAGSFALPAAVYAQVATPSAAPDIAAPAPAAASDIVVTGSRVVKNGADSPTPVSVVTAQEIQRAAPVTIADYVNELPALSGSTTPRTPGSSVGTATGGANLLNLRGLGTNRTLVLVDGRRMTPSFLTGVVDINTIPTALVKRVDVVTGGASASYGSDAVAGVVNFVLDDKFTGIKGGIQGGVSQLGDAGNISGDLSFGTKFAGGAGHFIISGSYVKQNPAFLDGHGWYRAYKFLANPAFVAGGSQPANLILPNSTLNTTNFGLIGTGPLKGTAFNAAGGVATTNFPFGPITSGFIQSGGTENNDNALGNVVQMQTANEQGNVFSLASYDLSHDITAYAEASYGKSKASNQSGLLWRVGQETIQSGNAYLPASVQQAMTANGVASFPLYTNNRSLGVPTGYYTRDVLRLLAGVKGDFGKSWHWDVSYQYGRATAHNRVEGDIIVGNFNQAINAVVSPATGGIVCASTLTNPGNGCVPYNPFGERPLTAAQAAYMLGTSSQYLVYRQDVVDASLRGDLFNLPAGAVSVAIGGQYRREHADATSDALSQATVFYVGNYKPFSGGYDVKEGFAEVLVPILKDSPVGKSLDFNGAVRVTDYSSSGTVETWKAGGVYQPVRDISLRTTLSRDIRAPNLNELFQGGTFAQQSIFNPFRGNASTQFNAITIGNSALKPEVARSLTAGLVFQPHAVPGLSFSVDYYNIRLAGAISTFSAQVVVNQCFAGVAQFCSAITGNPSVAITAVNLQPFNANAEKERGIDFELDYSHPVGRGRLDFRSLLNYTDSFQIISPSSTIQLAGDVGTNLGVQSGVPHLTGLTTVAYSLEPVTFQLKGRFIGSANVQNGYTAANINLQYNHVPAYMYLDAFLGFDANVAHTKFQFFLAIDNLLNTSPPVVVSNDNTNTQAIGTNPFIYDVIGRAFRAGARFQF